MIKSRKNLFYLNIKIPFLIVAKKTEVIEYKIFQQKINKKSDKVNAKVSRNNLCNTLNRIFQLK